MQKDNGGPAFPRPTSEDRTSGDLPDGNRQIAEQEGMSLRDYFAGRALSALVKADLAPEIASGLAYAYADAMLVERQQSRK